MYPLSGLPIMLLVLSWLSICYSLHDVTGLAWMKDWRLQYCIMACCSAHLISYARYFIGSVQSFFLGGREAAPPTEQRYRPRPIGSLHACLELLGSGGAKGALAAFTAACMDEGGSAEKSLAILTRFAKKPVLLGCTSTASASHSSSGREISCNLTVVESKS